MSQFLLEADKPKAHQERIELPLIPQQNEVAEDGNRSQSPLKSREEMSKHKTPSRETITSSTVTRGASKQGLWSGSSIKRVPLSKKKL